MNLINIGKPSTNLRGMKMQCVKKNNPSRKWEEEFFTKSPYKPGDYRYETGRLTCKGDSGGLLILVKIYKTKISILILNLSHSKLQMSTIKLFFHFVGPLENEDGKIVGILGGEQGGNRSKECIKDENSFSVYINILQPWILNNLIKAKVPDVKVSGIYI